MSERRYSLNQSQGRFVSTGKDKSYRSRDVWEKENGPIPDGGIIHHKNANPSFDGPCNLDLLSRADHTKHHKRIQSMEPLPRGVKVKRVGEQWYVLVNHHGKRISRCVGIDKEKALKVAWKVWSRINYPEKQTQVNATQAQPKSERG